MKEPASASTELAAMELLEAAMEQQEDDRENFINEFRDAADEVRQRALQLLVSDRESLSALRTGGAADQEDDEELPSRIGAYRILRLLGRGGMGAVFLGERASDDFEHVVAIKLIKQRLLSESLIDRFRRERQILAQLNHPHIAHFYDGGETEDGSPYIVMEYVDGIPLTKWVKQQNPDFDRRLKLFTQICEAVEFAHQNLIIHRDLTPSNVLITEGDQAKLIDFGIARPQAEDDDDSAASTFSGLSLTPGFAAPERSKGAAANTLSDIYSLGRVLHFLTKDFDKPEVAAIAAKATRVDPDDRYVTARGLTNDLQNFRSDIPVTAFSDQKRYRFRKFIIREKLAVGATLALIFLLVAGLGATGWAYSRAENARAETELRFAETRSIANIMMFDVFDEVSKIPGSTKARVILAETAQKYLDSLAADSASSADLQLEAGKGYFRLYRAIGGSQGGSLGKLAEGKELLERSRKILERLYIAHPDRNDVRAAYGKTLTLVAGETLYTDGDFKMAVKTANRARTILTSIDEYEPESANSLGTAYNYEGESYAWAGDYKQAGETFSKGIEAMEGLPAALRETVEVKQVQGRLLAVLSVNFANQGKFEDALRALKESLRVRREVVKLSANAPSDVRNLTITYHQLGKIYLATGQSGDALQSARQASELARDSMKKSPDDLGPKELFTGTALLEGEALSKLGRHSEAVAIAGEGIAVNRELLKLTGDVAAGPMNLAVRLFEASAIYSVAGLKQKSCSAMRESVGYMKDFEKTAELPATNKEQQLKPMLATLKSC